MRFRRVISVLTLVCSFALGCDDDVGVGSSCFDTGECSSGACTVTVYGRFCLETCDADTVRCEDAQACIEGEEITPSGGAGGAAGMGGAGGAGGESGTGLFVCLPGDLNIPDFEPVLISNPCNVSLDCELGGICVCPAALDCTADENGAICVDICDPTRVNECPFDQACVDLGGGRGFCDPETSVTN